jgi:predicted DCC family thiol-disulfide oxidoreductase YuxK
MGVSGATVWATLIFCLSMLVSSESWSAQGVALYGGIVVAYLAFLASLVLAPLGALIGWQMPRRLNGLRPWSVFLLGGYTGAFAGALTALGFMGAGTVQAGWSAMQDTLPFYLLTLPTVFGLWTGLWIQRWRDRLPQGHVAGRLYWDADCPFCIRWVGRLAFVARQGGFALVPLQAEEARRDLGLREGELPVEMKLRLADGRLLGGVDAFIAMAEAAGWTAPLGWLLRAPGVNALAWRGYRWVARNRHCLGGNCALPPQEGRRV